MKNFFNISSEEYLIFQIKKENIDDFKTSLPEKFRDCYIPRDKLKSSIKNLEMKSEEILKSYIPDLKNVMSGEFGEILTYYLLISNSPDSIVGPKKWLWKDDKNKAIQKTDVILFHKTETSSNDYIISAEVKSKATKNAAYNPTENAIAGVIDDSISRLSKTLVWLREKAIKEEKQDTMDFINRYLKISEFGTYSKKFKAVVVYDYEIFLKEKDIVDSSFNNFINSDSCNFEFELMIILINNMKSIYEQIYNDILISGCEFDD